MLHYVDYQSEGHAAPILIAHGLFGSARNWNVLAKRLSDRGPLRVVDMRNHGQSAQHQTQSYPEMAADLAQVIRAYGAPMDVIGHSMGGKAAMMLALEYPDLVSKLVVADIAPVGYGHSQTPLIHAMQRLDLSLVEKRSDADKLLQADIPEPGVRAFLLQALDVPQKSWRLNLEALENAMEQIIGFPQSEASVLAGAFQGDALFLTGALSNYVTPEHRPEIKTLFPQARFAKIPQAGHWLHAEKPREFEAAVRVFLG